MCPHLSLYDLRVFDKDGRGDEFAILCAIEFVGWLNRDRANPVVHGVNLSLALAHDVDSFACGQTPICEACNHLVGAGTVVVAAAGNTGFEAADAEKQSLGTGYRAISITDPGNADHVITVGVDPSARSASLWRELFLRPRPDRRRPAQAGHPRARRKDHFDDPETDGQQAHGRHVDGGTARQPARRPC